jgi:beta-N-acetylhexosaminidase
VSRHSVVLVVAFLMACARGGPVSPGAEPVAAPPVASTPAFAAAPVTPAPPGEDPDLERLLEGLSLRDRAAQLVWPWIPGGYVPADEETYTRTVARWVDSLHVGGVLISIGGPLDAAARLNDLQRRAPLPLLVGSDLESGSSFRLVGATATPPAMAVGASGDAGDAFAIGRITAREARAVGIHVVFAPVADVNANPANPVINIRAFGEDPAAVARLTAAAVRALEANGVASVPKHFPGHGDTDTDTHVRLPTLAADWARLDSVELVPFRAAVQAGATGIMSAHIALPALDGGRVRPATLAPPLLAGLLRDSLRFGGLIVTDALNMGALVATHDAAAIATGALAAGADVLLQPADPAVMIDAVAEAVRAGRITPERLDASVRRVLALKARLGLFRRRTVSLDSVPLVVGNAAFQRTADSIAARSVVLATDRDGLVPRLRGGPQRIAVVAYGDDRSPAVGQALAAELRARGHTVTLTRLWPQSGSASYDTARTALAASPLALFAVAARPLPWDAARLTLPAALGALIDSTARARPTVLASFGSPYIRMQAPAAGTYVLGWLANPAMERAVARALTGAAITGRLPIRIPPDLPLGAGLLLDARP